MDMSEASAYFGVEVPIGKRDRKSGAKKRKQLEIEAESLTVAIPFDETIALTLLSLNKLTMTGGVPRGLEF